MTFPTIVTSRRVVPNQPPLLEPHPYRIAIVGEAPGEDEEAYGIPFCGRSGQFLDRLLLDVGIERRRCFVGNICNVRPPANDITRFDWTGPEITEGLQRLSADLSAFSPNICFLLGGSALHAAHGHPSKITEWRGSLFISKSDGPFLHRKCLASLHPAAVLREFSGFPLLKFDASRVRREAESPDLVLPSRDLITNMSAGELVYLMDHWPSGLRCSLDIEGGLSGWPCVSICSNPTRSITIAWGKFSLQDHALVLQSFARLMARIDVPKVLQNSLYDNFVLSYGYAIPIRNVVEDTMLKGWECYCELPKGLGTQASIWTREPAYKFERKSDDQETYYRYCAKDSAVTLEICEAQDQVITKDPGAFAHYRANVSMLNPLLYMELRGIKYDTEQVEKRKKEVQSELTACGDALCERAKMELRGAKGSLSSKRLAEALYVRMSYPPQYKKELGRKTEKLTTDVEAMLNLRRKLPSDEFLTGVLRHRHLEGLLETLEIKPDEDGRVRCGYNVVGTETGRLTCYTSPTGSGANLQTITKSLRSNYIADDGYDFFQCDLAGADGWTVAAHCAKLGDRTMLDDYYSGLKPAKIVAMLYLLGAEINKLHRDDLLFWSAKRAFSSIETLAGKWVYDGSKVVQHGTNYLMGIPTMITNLMKRSFKETGHAVYMEHSDARTLQNCYFSRYPGVPLWHRWGEAHLVAKGELVSASGQRRIFFGRRFGKDIHDTVKEFLAHEPQSNTTWATNLAMLRLWNDPANRLNSFIIDPRTSNGYITTCDGTMHTIPRDQVPFLSRLRSGSLLVEPLHTVHDALCGQWPSVLREWARVKVREWFNNSLTIAGTTLVIPFDGGYGRSWGELNAAL